MLKMATAIRKGGSPGQLGLRLAQDALRKLKGAEPAFAMVFVTSRLDLGQFVPALRQALGSVPLLGCTTAGEFTEEGVETGAATLALFSRSEEYDFHLSLAEGLHADPAGCIQKAVEGLPAQPERFPHRAAILLHDGLSGRGEEAVLTATALLGPEVFFAGGAAADDLGFKQTWVIYNDRITTDSAALCVIDSRQQVAIGVRHGHKPVSKKLTVTKSADTRLYEVDGRPAWEVWKTALAAEAKRAGIDLEALKTPTEVGQLLLKYELGLATGRNYKVRVPLSKNDDGSLNFACTIPEGVQFRIMKSGKREQILSATQSAAKAKKQMGKRKIAGALVFDCVCRGLILGPDFGKSVQAIRKVVGKVPLMGFETYGEICRRPGQLSGLHNTTTVIMLLAQ